MSTVHTAQRYNTNIVIIMMIAFFLSCGPTSDTDSIIWDVPPECVMVIGCGIHFSTVLHYTQWNSTIKTLHFSASECLLVREHELNGRASFKWNSIQQWRVNCCIQQAGTNTKCVCMWHKETGIVVEYLLLYNTHNLLSGQDFHCVLLRTIK